MTTPASEQPPTWRSRIVGEGDEAPDALNLNPRNWRTHPQGQLEALAGALDEVGWVQRVIVNRRTGLVVDGHARVELARARGEQSVPVLFVDLTEEEEALVLATLDPIAAMAGTNKEALAALMEHASANTAGLKSLLGSLVPVAKAGLTDPDAVPDDPKTVTVKRGELYLLGEHRLMCGDSTDPEDVVRLTAGVRGSLLATDPPYLVDYQGGNHPQSWANKPDVKDKHWDDYRDPAAAAGFFADYLRAWLPHCVEDVPVYQWHATRRQALVEEAWKQAGLLVHQTIVWVKSRPVLTRSHFMWQHEPCFYGWPEGHQPTRKPPASARSVWEIGTAGENDNIHPTQKPVELFARPIEYHTAVDEVCFEPFSGSGTQLIAAERAQRRCFAMEIEPKYAQVAIERWENFTGQKARRETKRERRPA